MLVQQLDYFTLDSYSITHLETLLRSNRILQNSHLAALSGRLASLCFDVLLAASASWVLRLYRVIVASTLSLMIM